MDESLTFYRDSMLNMHVVDIRYFNVSADKQNLFFFHETQDDQVSTLLRSHNPFIMKGARQEKKFTFARIFDIVVPSLHSVCNDVFLSEDKHHVLFANWGVKQQKDYTDFQTYIFAKWKKSK